MNNSQFISDNKDIPVINNKKYYLRYRYKDIGNPVVLFLHGGPGNPDRHNIIKFQSALANVFTLVAWDQTGSGKAYNKVQSKEEISIDSLVEDAHIVVLYLKEHFNKDKIYIVGHSWGSVLGVLLCQKYPSDIAAYVGVGQYINGIENERLLYKFVMEQAHIRKDGKGIKQLMEVGEPVMGKYKDNKIALIRNYLHKYGGASYNTANSIWKDVLSSIPVMLKEYSLMEIFKYIKGMNYTLRYIDTSKIDFLTSVKRLEIPVYLMLGHHDYNCPYILAEQWLEQLEAPVKQLIWFEKSAHSPQWEEAENWNNILTKLMIK